MALRTRIRSTDLVGRRTLKGNGQVETKSLITLSERADDETGFGDNFPFTVTRTIKSGGLINGEQKSNLSGYIWDNYPCTYWGNVFMTSHLSLPDRPSDGFMAAEMLSRTQPYRSEIISTEYVSELSSYGSSAEDLFRKSLERLRQAVPENVWRTLRGAAKVNVLTQFAILPLISDIEVLLEFQTRVNKRVKVLERLYSRNGYRRTATMYLGSNTQTLSQTTVQSSGINLKADLVKTTTSKVRAHVRWRALIPLPRSDADILKEAKRLVLGARLDPFTFYEIMPWSWLIDYFTNLGTIIRGSGNALELTHDAVRIMEHLSTKIRSYNTPDKVDGTYVVTFQPMFSDVVSKTRRLATPTLEARTGMLNGSQLSILGSLAVLRA